MEYLAFLLAVVIYLIFGSVTDNEIVRDRLPDRISKWYNQAKEASKITGVPLKYILGIIAVESNGNPEAIGSAGEIGLMQLKEIAVRDVYENLGVNVENWKTGPYDNILAGSYFLKLQKKRSGSWDVAIRSYNQGFEGQKNNELATVYLNKVNSFINNYSNG